ncbi:hypothetical protein F5148DRAFT_1166714 [Russula earlei]|uniref:Uncharacterized protein n=1 Tax=Russula earlei TaxID=71964 RepID=A0ACC0UK19_9AGAM|nr:hypothetical protein F5148DRAFT_1166714 [Russula earlei]
MRASSVFVTFCLAVGIAPSFALPLDIRSPDLVLHTRGNAISQKKDDKQGETTPPERSRSRSSSSRRSRSSSRSSSSSLDNILYEIQNKPY